MTNFNILPTEIIRDIALSVDDCNTLCALSLTNRICNKVSNPLSFRVAWLHKRQQRRLERIQTMPLQHRVLAPASMFIEATQLHIRLPRSAFRSYLEEWLRVCEKNPPVLVGDGFLRDAFIVHCWKEAIPLFLRNQMAPPVDDDATWVIQQDRHVGPDFNDLLAWLVDECSTAEHETDSDKLLPEGLFDAVQDPFLMSSFRPGWIKVMLNLTCKEIPLKWRSWISRQGYENVAFDEDGLRNFQLNIKKQIDPWAMQVNRQVWRM